MSQRMRVECRQPRVDGHVDAALRRDVDRKCWCRLRRVTATADLVARGRVSLRYQASFQI